MPLHQPAPFSSETCLVLFECAFLVTNREIAAVLEQFYVLFLSLEAKHIINIPHKDLHGSVCDLVDSIKKANFLCHFYGPISAYKERLLFRLHTGFY